MKKSVAKELDTALIEMFSAMKISSLKVENNLSLDISNFIKDLKKTLDEIHSAKDIAQCWHISKRVAEHVFAVIKEVVFGDPDDLEWESENENIGNESESSSESDSSSDGLESDVDDDNKSFSSETDSSSE